MILTWMLSAVIIAGCCALAASVAEWTLALRRRLPVRWVWAAALLTAVVAPAIKGSDQGVRVLDRRSRGQSP